MLLIAILITWLKNTKNYSKGTQGKNKHGDPNFLMQFLNVLYIADKCAKLEKNLDCTSFQGNYFNP